MFCGLPIVILSSADISRFIACSFQTWFNAEPLMIDKQNDVNEIRKRIKSGYASKEYIAEYFQNFHNLEVGVSNAELLTKWILKRGFG